MKKTPFKAIYTGYALWLACFGFDVCAAPNPASQDWVKDYVSQHVNQNTAQGNYTSNSWTTACPTGQSGLLAGCLIKGNYAGLSSIGSLINSMWSGINTVPNATTNSVYIKKFPPGYVFSANNGRSLTYEATGIPTASTAVCTVDAISETGIDIDEYIQNNPTASTGDGAIYNVSSYARYIRSGTTYTGRILEGSPGTDGALPLAIPFYVVCLGINNTTGVPASIQGISVN